MTTPAAFINSYCIKFACADNERSCYHAPGSVSLVKAEEGSALSIEFNHCGPTNAFSFNKLLLFAGSRLVIFAKRKRKGLLAVLKLVLLRCI